MRIVIDLQGAQTASRYRGIGRYSLALALAIAKNHGGHEIIIALSSLFPETVAPIRAAFADILPPENVRVWHAPGPVREVDQKNVWRRQTAELIYEAFLCQLEPDIIHISSLFEGYGDDAVTSIARLNKSIPVSVTGYDLIPLLNPDSYLNYDLNYSRYYFKKLDVFKKASLVLAISEASRQEMLTNLSFLDDQIVNIAGAADERFYKLNIPKTEAKLLHDRFNIKQAFLLYTGADDERKNLSRLIRAYAKIPAALRETTQLVFAGKFSDIRLRLFKDEAKRAGIANDRLIFTGYVSDDELLKLINLCALYVFPSWQEGLGLPILEAMACGVPVICSNIPSLNEFVEHQEALFDPMCESSIAQCIADTLQNKSLMQKLRASGLEKAKQYTWQNTALKTISAFEKYLEQGINARYVGNRSHVKNYFEHANKLSRQLINAVSKQPTDTLDIKFDLARVAASIATNLTENSRFMNARKLPEKINWLIEGPFDSIYSLALLNRETARALAMLGHNVILNSTDGPGDFEPRRAYLKLNPDLAEMYARKKKIQSSEMDVVSRNLYPPRVSDMTSKLNMLHHYAWEESGFPLVWVDYFNDYLQGITCLSNHVEKILIDHGVTIPLSVSGCGIDHWDRTLPDENYDVPGKKFKFLHISCCAPRKGVDLLLDAYGRAFTAKDNVTLIIKTYTNPHNEVQKWLREVQASHANYPDVVIIETDLTDSQIKTLYSKCQALVAPSLAEGFGLPIAEAMLSELPVITTGWGGQLDFCNEQTAWLIDYKFDYAQTHFGLFDSVWAIPDIQQLSNVMQEIYHLSTSQRKSRSKVGRDLLLKDFKWEHVVVRLINLAREWSELKDIVAQPRIGWVTTWNTPCGIASYSENLIARISSELTILANHTVNQIKADDIRVTRCWHENSNLEQLANVIESRELDTLVIQFNYGFFDFEQFKLFLENQLDNGKIIVLMMHATIDPPNHKNKKLAYLIEPLRRCHRILVHSINDLNRLKDLGLVENVTLFPQGLIEPEINNDRRPISTPITLASYGFFLPNKGLLELIDAVALLKKQNFEVKLRMVNAEYTNPVSAEIIKQAKNKISDYGLDNDIEMITDYLTDEKSIALLQDSDLIIFSYQKTGESSSAAVRFGIASGSPVLVTPLPIFDDVASAVWKLPGTTPEAIAEGIKHQVNEVTIKSASYEAKAKMAKKWREAHRYPLLSKRLDGMLKALKLKYHA